MKTFYNQFKNYVNNNYDNFIYGDEKNEKFLENIVNYFGTGETCYDRSKGLLIRGGYGVGKTTILKLIQKTLQEDKKFAYNPSNDVVANFNIGGDDQIKIYKNKKERLFDDLGAEDMGKNYGNNVEVFQKIIYSRYDLLKYENIRTHITTNLTNDEIIAKYGERAYDRFKDMFNVVRWNFTTSIRGKNKFKLKEPKEIKTEKPIQTKEEEEKESIKFMNTVLFNAYDLALENKTKLSFDRPTAIIMFKKFYAKNLISIEEKDKLTYNLRAVKALNDKIGLEGNYLKDLI